MATSIVTSPAGLGVTKTSETAGFFAVLARATDGVAPGSETSGGRLSGARGVAAINHVAANQRVNIRLIFLLQELNPV
jgi:hypothetical protein